MKWIEFVLQNMRPPSDADSTTTASCLRSFRPGSILNVGRSQLAEVSSWSPALPGMDGPTRFSSCGRL